MRITPALAETDRLRTVLCSGTPKGDHFILNFPWGEILPFSILILMIFGYLKLDQLFQTAYL